MPVTATWRPGYCRHCRRIYDQRVAAELAATAEAARQTAAAARNATGLCGWEGCPAPPLVVCDREGLLYCTRHTNRYHYRYHYRTRRGVETGPAEVTLCDACKVALPEYKRERTWQDV